MVREKSLMGAASPRGRALSALVEHAKSTFEKRTQETNLVAPISPTPPELIQTVLDALALGTHDFVIDLGCGDGRWLVAAALRGCAGRGLDLNEALLRRGRQDAADAGVSSLVELENGDIFETALAGRTVIIVYLFREGMSKMKEKLETEAEPGARVVSVGFQIRGWASESTFEVGRLRAYLYRVPRREEEAA